MDHVGNPQFDWSKGKIAMVSCMFHVDIFPFNQSIEVGDDGSNGPKTCGKDSPQKQVHHNPGFELELELNGPSGSLFFQRSGKLTKKMNNNDGKCMDHRPSKRSDLKMGWQLGKTVHEKVG